MVSRTTRGAVYQLQDMAISIPCNADPARSRGRRRSSISPHFISVPENVPASLTEFQRPVDIFRLVHRSESIRPEARCHSLCTIFSSKGGKAQCATRIKAE